MKKRNKYVLGVLSAVAITLVTGSAIAFSSCNEVRSNNEPPSKHGFQVVLDTSISPVIHLEYNMIQFYSRKALDHFYKSWHETSEKKLSVVHLGDSHLQSDIFPGQVRKNLHTLHGDGGRGLIFPYSTAKTYSSVEYKSEHTGEWEYAKSLRLPPKIPLGVVGMSSKTVEKNASFTLTFDDPVPQTYDRLRVYCKKEHNSFDLEVDFGDGKPVLVKVDSSSTDTLPYYEINIPKMGTVLKATVVKSKDYQNEFEFYGMTMQTSADNGAVLHNCGVGGAMYRSILYEDLFEEQLPTLDPDLVIVDFGTNDYLYDDSIKTDLDSQIVLTIERIRRASPGVSIILTSTQDMYWKGDNLLHGEDFSDLVHDIAKRYDCGLFDWYWISGGRTTMSRWMDRHYAQPDGIHLAPKGYRLKGDLLTDAMIRTMTWMEKNPRTDSLVFNTDSLSAIQKKLILPDSLRKNP
ncbi:MAG TPA: GDSL-type esterase/lipase family protein, partial [Bacteroidia bacterium]|nr:GDSL-type esterase/lipase family protein [Bacteroidia bacterium]